VKQSYMAARSHWNLFHRHPSVSSNLSGATSPTPSFSLKCEEVRSFCNDYAQNRKVKQYALQPTSSVGELPARANIVLQRAYFKRARLVCCDTFRRRNGAGE